MNVTENKEIIITHDELLDKKQTRMVVNVPNELRRRVASGNVSAAKGDMQIVSQYLVDTQIYRTLSAAIRDLLLCYPLRPYPLPFIGMKIMSGMVRQDMFYATKETIVSRYVN